MPYSSQGLVRTSWSRWVSKGEKRERRDDRCSSPLNFDWPTPTTTMTKAHGHTIEWSHASQHVMHRQLSSIVRYSYRVHPLCTFFHPWQPSRFVERLFKSNKNIFIHIVPSPTTSIQINVIESIQIVAYIVQLCAWQARLPWYPLLYWVLANEKSFSFLDTKPKASNYYEASNQVAVTRSTATLLIITL